MSSKAIPMLILFLTGSLSNNMNVAAGTPPFSPEETTPLSHTVLPAAKATQAPESGTTPYENDHIQEERLPTIVAGISISLVLTIILFLIGVWYARRKSRGSLAEINSVPSGETGVSLKKISTHENQHEWPFERALQ